MTVKSFTNFNVFSRYLGSHFISFHALFLMFTLVSFSTLISSRTEKMSHPGLKFNTRIYNLISVPQITRLLLGDTIISSKTDQHNGSKKEKRSYGEVKNNSTMLKTLPFIKIIYLKQQSSILRCFCRLKFEKSLINNTFFSFIFHSKMISSYS